MDINGASRCDYCKMMSVLHTVHIGLVDSKGDGIEVWQCYRCNRKYGRIKNEQ